MLKEIFHDSLNKDLYGKPLKCDWVARVVERITWNADNLAAKT